MCPCAVAPYVKGTPKHRFCCFWKSHTLRENFQSSAPIRFNGTAIHVFMPSFVYIQSTSTYNALELLYIMRNILAYLPCEISEGEVTKKCVVL